MTIKRTCEYNIPVYEIKFPDLENKLDKAIYNLINAELKSGDLISDIQKVSRVEKAIEILQDYVKELENEIYK